MGSRIELKKTKTWWFLTPILELDQYNLNYKYLLNVYLKSETHPEYDNKDIIIYHYDFMQPGGSFAKLERNLSSLPNFIFTYDPDNYTTLFFFHIPRKWYNDYLLFINGQYSLLSTEYKTLLLNFYKMSGSYSNAKEVEKILNKSQERRMRIEEDLQVTLPPDAEVASIITWSIETYSKERYGIKNALDKTEFDFLNEREA